MISKNPPIKTKKDTIVQCLIADQTASIFMNFYNETGLLIKEGDIMYASGIYASHYREMLLLYQGNLSIIRRIGRNFMNFNVKKNMSEESMQQSKE